MGTKALLAWRTGNIPEFPRYQPTEQEAKELLEKYYRAFPALKEYQKKIKEQMSND